MNAPENFELFNLPEGKKKVEYTKLERYEHTGFFTILLEDDTMGNIIKMMLLRDKRVRYAGYRKPHPLENKIEIQIQTNGETTPSNALRDAIKNLVDDIDLVSKKFGEDTNRKRVSNSNL